MQPLFLNCLLFIFFGTQMVNGQRESCADINPLEKRLSEFDSGAWWLTHVTKLQTDPEECEGYSTCSFLSYWSSCGPIKIFVGARHDHTQTHATQGNPKKQKISEISTHKTETDKKIFPNTGTTKVGLQGNMNDSNSTPNAENVHVLISSMIQPGTKNQKVDPPADWVDKNNVNSIGEPEGIPMEISSDNESTNQNETNRKSLKKRKFLLDEKHEEEAKEDSFDYYSIEAVNIGQSRTAFYDVKHHYGLDNSYTYHEEVFSIFFVQEDGKQIKFENILTNEEIVKREKLSFALINYDEEGRFAIFQSCNKKHAWVLYSDAIVTGNRFYEVESIVHNFLQEKNIRTAPVSTTLPYHAKEVVFVKDEDK